MDFGYLWGLEHHHIEIYFLNDYYYLKPIKKIYKNIKR
jgi:hypothetical protein